MGKKKNQIGRDAITGRFVSIEKTKEKPDTTIIETRKKQKKK